MRETREKCAEERYLLSYFQLASCFVYLLYYTSTVDTACIHCIGARNMCILYVTKTIVEKRSLPTGTIGKMAENSREIGKDQFLTTKLGK